MLIQIEGRVSVAAKLQRPEVPFLVKHPRGLACVGESHLAAPLCSGSGGREDRSPATFRQSEEGALVWPWASPRGKRAVVQGGISSGHE